MMRLREHLARQTLHCCLSTMMFLLNRPCSAELKTTGFFHYPSLGNSTLYHFAVDTVSFQRPLTCHTSCGYLTFYDASTCCSCLDPFSFHKITSEPGDNSFPSHCPPLRISHLLWHCLNSLWKVLCFVIIHIYNSIRDCLEY